MIEQGSAGAPRGNVLDYMLRARNSQGSALPFLRIAGGDAAGIAEIRDVSGLSLRLVGGSPVVDRPGNAAALAAKRSVDIVLSLAALLFLAPLLLCVALLIRSTSAGPALFRQVREGQGGKPIAVYKFRSMYFDRCDSSGVCQTRAGEDRVTAVGKFIRLTSIDELPQLINVLRGDMSLVGPRPHVPDMLACGVRYDQLVPYYHMRGLMKPGLSGWAQANGLRGATHDADLARARVDHDLAYIANFSPGLDLKIILMTLAHELSGGSGS